MLRIRDNVVNMKNYNAIIENVLQTIYVKMLYPLFTFFLIDKLCLGMNALKEISNIGNICDVTYGSFMSLDTIDGMLKYDYNRCTYVGK